MDQQDELQKIAEGKTNAKTAQAIFAVTLQQIKEDIHSVKGLLENDYAKFSYAKSLETRIRMLERIVYGAVSVILLSVFGALVALVVQR